MKTFRFPPCSRDREITLALLGPFHETVRRFVGSLDAEVVEGWFTCSIRDLRRAVYDRAGAFAHSGGDQVTLSGDRGIHIDASAELEVSAMLAVLHYRQSRALADVLRTVEIR